MALRYLTMHPFKGQVVEVDSGGDLAPVRTVPNLDRPMAKAGFRRLEIDGNARLISDFLYSLFNPLNGPGLFLHPRTKEMV